MAQAAVEGGLHTVWVADHPLQETRRYKPSTVSRRTSVIAGFYRTCVIGGVLEHSPADYVRRPTVPPESPTLGLHPSAVRGDVDRRPCLRQPA
ncbi:MAG: hypothetical protein ACR2JG_07785 [Geodermatophilaceae bacterium]